MAGIKPTGYKREVGRVFKGVKTPFQFKLQRFAGGDADDNGGGKDDKGKGKVEFSEEQQAELDRIIRDRVSRAEKGAGKTALEARAKELGFASAEEMETALKAHKAAKDKETSDLDKEKTGRQTAEQERDAARAEAKAAKVDAAARIHAITLGVKPERIDYLLKLANLDGVELKDGKADDEAIKAALEAVLKDVPELKGANGGAGSGNNPGDQSKSENPWKKETFNLTKQAEILKKDPALAERLKAEAKGK